MSDYYEGAPVLNGVNCAVSVPGSKSITGRALVLASMARGRSVLKNVSDCDDSRALIDCLTKLGYDITEDSAGGTVKLTGGKPAPNAAVNVQSAGTAARFLTALLAANAGEYIIDASSQMKRRPIAPLCDALANLGARFEYLEKEDYLPFKLAGGALAGGEVMLDAGSSSQFISALLMTAILYKNGLTIIPRGKEISKTYIDITLKMMEHFGVAATRARGCYIIRPGQCYTAQNYEIEPDISSACYFYAAACLTGGAALVKGAFYSSIQGDIKFLDILKAMGCSHYETPDGVMLTGPKNGAFKGIDIDLNDCSDQTMTLSALAPFASSPVTIRNIEHIKHQESDRISAILTELKKMDVRCERHENGFTIYPGTPKPTVVETYNDHRMAMAFALTGLRAPGIKIDNPSCVSKTFKNYFAVLDDVRKGKSLSFFEVFGEV